MKRSERARPSPTVMLAVLALLVALLVLPLALAPRAEAYIYWTYNRCVGPVTERECTGTLGRANLDGTAADESFLDHGWQAVQGLAVDADHIYWLHYPEGDIARARLDGKRVDQDFITGIEENGPFGLAVDANYIYWTHGYPNRIGRANLDGTGLEEGFISAEDSLYSLRYGDVAVDAQYVYWTDIEAHTIGRANLDGGGVNQSFISGIVGPRGLTVDGEHIYWSNDLATIGRANLDGTNVDQGLIDVARTPTTSGLGYTSDVAVDAQHIYWGGRFHLPGQRGFGVIGRAKLDGTAVDQRFLSLRRTGTPVFLAVDSRTDTRVSADATAKRTQKAGGSRVSVALRIKAKERLAAKTSGKIKVNPTYKLKPKRAELDAGETRTLKLRPEKAKAKKIAEALKRGEKAKAKLTVELTDLAGNSETEKLRVRLRR